MMNRPTYIRGQVMSYSIWDRTGHTIPMWAFKRDDHVCCLVRDCSSTMNVAGGLLDQGRFPDWSWVLAQTQTKGRGQFGRSWISRPGNLFATICLPGKAGILGNLLSLSLGAVMADVVSDLGLPAEVKWPNDILVGQAKIGGILIEQRKENYLAGIGFNLNNEIQNHAQSDLFNMPVGSFQTFGVTLSPLALWLKIEKYVKQYLPEYMVHPQKVIDRLASCLAFKNKPVVVTHAGGHDGPAIVMDVSITGELIIRTALGNHRINKGQILPQVV